MSNSNDCIQQGMISVEIETLAILLYNEHKAHGDTKGWFDVKSEKRSMYRSIASGDKKMPVARKRSS